MTIQVGKGFTGSSTPTYYWKQDQEFHLMKLSYIKKYKAKKTPFYSKSCSNDWRPESNYIHICTYVCVVSTSHGCHRATILWAFFSSCTLIPWPLFWSREGWVGSEDANGLAELSFLARQWSLGRIMLPKILVAMGKVLVRISWQSCIIHRESELLQKANPGPSIPLKS